MGEIEEKQCDILSLTICTRRKDEIKRSSWFTLESQNNRDYEDEINVDDGMIVKDYRFAEVQVRVNFCRD